MTPNPYNTETFVYRPDAAPSAPAPVHRAGRIAGAILATAIIISGCADATQQEKPTFEASPAPYAYVPRKNLADEFTPARIAELESTYLFVATPDTPTTFAPHMYDEGLSNKDNILYKQQGVSKLSFSRPTRALNEQMLKADTIQQLEFAADASVRQMGIDISFGNPAAIVDEKQVAPVVQEDFPRIKQSLLGILGYISTQPREATMFGVEQITFTPNLIPFKDTTGSTCDKGQTCGAAGMTLTGKNKSNLLISYAPQSGDTTDIYRHEFGHAIADAISQKDTSFKQGYDNLNPGAFMYKGEGIAEGITSEAYSPIADQAVANKTVKDAYGASNVGEDIATGFTTLGETEAGMPDPADATFKTVLGSKRVYFVETFDKFVEGIKDYWISSISYPRFAAEQMFGGLGDLYRTTRSNARWPNAPDGPVN